MNIHQRIIGICWLVFGVLILSLVVLNLATLDSWARALGATMGILYLTAGFLLLANLPRAWRFGLPCAVLSLFTFPVGTPLGIYYLWYHFKRRPAD
ncbi:MAG: hypothetical protein Q8O64_01535 [Sideroxyarcus sp.]|nr:hypothetical protein [Sideroxyarcus sp.]